jgi:hypothetical protein
MRTNTRADRCTTQRARPGVATQPWTQTRPPISPHETPSFVARYGTADTPHHLHQAQERRTPTASAKTCEGRGERQCDPASETRSLAAGDRASRTAPTRRRTARTRADGEAQRAGWAVGSWTRLSTCSAGQRARPMPMQQPADVASGAWRKERAGERKERVTRASSPSTDRNRGRISRRSDCSPHLESQTQLVIATQLPQESRRTHSRDADLAGG